MNMGLCTVDKGPCGRNLLQQSMTACCYISARTKPTLAPMECTAQLTTNVTNRIPTQVVGLSHGSAHKERRIRK